MTKTNQSLKLPKPPERKWVSYETTRYLADLLQDYNLTTGILTHWEGLERIMLATQWEEEDPNVSKAMKKIMTNIKMFADQGKLDLEYIKKIPAP